MKKDNFQPVNLPSLKSRKPKKPCENSPKKSPTFVLRNPCGCPHPNVMAQSWVDEALRPGYDFDKASTTKPGTEQFTQVVWRATTQVGMALSEDEKLLGFETIVKLDI